MKTKILILMGLTQLALVTLHAQTEVYPVTYTGTVVVSDATSITTSGAVVVNSGANVTFVAGTRITLNAGFQASAGGIFHAAVGSLGDADGDSVIDALDPYPNDYYNNSSPTMTIVDGNNQSAAINTFNAQPFDVGVWNTAGTQPLVGAPVTLSVLSGGGKLALTNAGSPTLYSSLTVSTDQDGTVQAYYKQPSIGYVASHIRASAGNSQVTFNTISTSTTPGDSDNDGMADDWETATFGNLSRNGAGDYDSDGMIDAWEYRYGLSATTNDASADADGDGLSNQTEYTQGTSPANADRTVPSTPTLSSATATGASQVTLAWTTSTDTGAGTPGIAGYRIYRDGVMLSMPLITTTGYVDNGVTTQTGYGYKVKAVDLAGNLSSDSNEISVTTQGISYISPQVFGFTGGSQSFTVPAGVTSIRAKVWGAGGGAGYEHGSFLPKIAGGAGGYSQMEWPVQPGDVITIVVGEGGQTRGEISTYGGGGAGQYWSSSGGGRSEISAPNSVRLVAGGGGGGSTNIIESPQSGFGGNGGGANQSGVAGQNNRNYGSGSTAFGGAGATTSAGGAGGNPGGSGGNGSSLQGGATVWVSGHDSHGGAGGGGYFGGGAGSSWTSDGYRQAAGGGGGSGFANGGSGVTGNQDNNASDADWGGLAGAGGVNGSGGHGRVVLLLGYPAAPGAPAITSASSLQLTKGSAGGYTITATNSPTSYEIAGDPPPGMSINTGSGQITGTPTQVGNFRLQLKAINGAGSGTRELTLSVTTTETQLPVDTLVYNGSVSTSYTVAAGQYDNATLKAWGAGGGSTYHPFTGELLATGGKGGYAQMDIPLVADGSEVISLDVNISSKITLGTKMLIAGAGGRAGDRYLHWDPEYGGDGGNGGGANQAGLSGESVSSGVGGEGATTAGAGVGGSGNVVPGLPGWPNGYGDSGSGGNGGAGGAYFPGKQTGGTGGNGYFGGGGGGVWQHDNAGTTHRTGAGGGGGSGYANGGTNVIGYQHNNPSDPDWGNSAGEPNHVSRAVLLLRSTRPKITSPATWAIAQGLPVSYSITTYLNATGYAIQSGTLPAGLKLDGRSGIISGTATQTGNFSVTLVANNEFGPHVSYSLSITVSATSGSPQQNLPYVAGFEAYEGFTTGSIAGQNGWTLVQGAADVSTTLPEQGQNSARLPGASTIPVIRRVFVPAAGTPSVVFTDGYLRLTADPATNAASRLEVGPSWVALGKTGSQGEVMVFQPAGANQGSWQATGRKFALDGSNQTIAWVRLTLRQDYSAKTWDLYVDGKLAATGNGFTDNTVATFTQFTLRGHTAGITYLDRLSITYHNALFTDADGDGMDDAWESANGLNPATNDRNGDLDSDGLSNLQEFLRGTRANLTDTDGDGFTDSQEVTSGTDPLVSQLPDPAPLAIILTEPIGATLQP